MGDRTHRREKRRGVCKKASSQTRVVGHRGKTGLELWYYVGGGKLVAQVRDVWRGRLFFSALIDYLAWRGMTPEGRRDMANAWIRRAEKVDKERDALAAGHDEEMSATQPALHAYLTSLEGPDGEVRRPASLTVFFEEGMCKGVLNDRAEERSLWASSDSLAGLLAAMDGLLQGVCPPWRKQGQKPQVKRR